MSTIPLFPIQSYKNNHTLIFNGFQYVMKGKSSKIQWKHTSETDWIVLLRLPLLLLFE